MTLPAQVAPTARQQLIPVFIGEIAGQHVPLVNGRQLHAFLEVGKHFASWMDERIEEYGFQLNQDFVSFSQNGGKSKRGRPAIEYHLTLDMAKELAMVERNDKGREVRRYFIECERRALEIGKTNAHQQLEALAAERDKYYGLVNRFLDQHEDTQKRHETQVQALSDMCQTYQDRNRSLQAQLNAANRKIAETQNQWNAEVVELYRQLHTKRIQGGAA